MKKINKRWIIIAGILVVGIVALLVVPRVLANANQAANGQYQIAALERGDLTAFVGATGTVRSNQSVILSWQTSGVIGKVSAQKRQKVEANAVLAELQQTSLAQNVILAQADLVNAQEALENLLDSSEERATAEINLIKAQKALDDAEKKRASKDYQRASQETIDIAKANLILANEALHQAQDFFDQVKSHTNENDIAYANALSQLAAARQKQTQAQYNYNYVIGLPSADDIQEADANVDLAKAQYLAAKKAWEDIKDGPNEQDVAAAEARVAAAQATLNLAHITAPFAGTITDVQATTGGQAAPGTVAFQLDDLSHLYVDIDVSEVDIDQVKIGQPVTLTLDALPNKEFQGKVTDVAPVGKAPSGTVNFTVTVEIADQSNQIRPGMTAAANIAVTELKQVLLVPNRAIRTQNGKRILFVMRNGIATPLEVTLGASSNSYSELTQGDVHEGDQIVINPPSLTLINASGQHGGSGMSSEEAQ